MKRIFALLLVVLTLAGCATKEKTKTTVKETVKSDPCEFLINADWVGDDDACENHISFRKDGSFSNYCACGSPIGDGDIIEKYTYNSKKNTISLYSEGEVYEEAKILFVDDFYLIVDMWGKVYTYENQKANLPQANEIAATEIGNAEFTKPCLMVLGYENNELTVSSHNYDGDSKKLFKEWKLKAAPDIKFKDVSVKVENGVPTMVVKELVEEDYQYIGEYYTGGYFEISEEGTVKSIVFYGELIIQ